MRQEMEEGTRVPASACPQLSHRLRRRIGTGVLLLVLAGCGSQGATSPGEEATSPGDAPVAADPGSDQASATGPDFALASTTTVQPWRDETFATYSSDASWYSDPHNWMVTASSWMNQSSIHIDKTVTYDSHQTLRYDWPGASSSNTFCNSQIAREADYYMPTSREVWIEIVHKFATTFNTNNKIDGGYCGTTEYKMLLPRLSGVSFRIGETKNGHDGHQWWGVHPGPDQTSWGTNCSMIGFNCRLGYGTGQDIYRASVPGPLWDGAWHVYRLHIKLPAYKGEKSGILEFWIDGKLLKRVTNQTFISRTGAFSNVWSSLGLGGNSNSGTSRKTSEWWGRLRIWTTNPMW
jgi:hypothetical protein